MYQFSGNSCDETLVNIGIGISIEKLDEADMLQQKYQSHVNKKKQTEELQQKKKHELKKKAWKEMKQQK